MSAERRYPSGQPEQSPPWAVFEHVAALAALATQAPVVVLTAALPGSAAPVHVHHGPEFAGPRLSSDSLPGAPPRLADGSRLVFHHTESLYARAGRVLGNLTLYDLVPRTLAPAQQAIVLRLARQAADLAEFLWTPQTVSEAARPPPAEQGFPDRETFDHLPAAVARFDAQFNLEWANPRACDALGFQPSDFGRTNLWDHVPEALGTPFHEACLRARQERFAREVEDWFPLRNRRAETCIIPVTHGLVLVVRDITEQHMMQVSLQATEDRLRALSQGLRTAQEDERRRISRELHDVVGQDLSVIKLRLEMLKKRLARAQRNKAHAALCQEIIDDTASALAAARRLATDLRPSILDKLGLQAAVQWQAQEIQRRTGIICRVHTDTRDERIPGGRDTAAFRALQELLTNVLRHADATHVDIDLTEREGELRLEVRDDGRGLPKEATEPADPLAPRESLGLLGVKERVAALGGTVQFESKKGQGTRVRITLPPPPTEPREQDE